MEAAITSMRARECSEAGVLSEDCDMLLTFTVRWQQRPVSAAPAERELKEPLFYLPEYSSGSLSISAASPVPRARGAPWPTRRTMQRQAGID